MLYLGNTMRVSEYDLCVIGGGINGAGIARDAAGRGLSVLLVEAGDLASATSSASTKLIHGGLRYLEYLEFRLVRESLKEREILLGLAPHIIRPMDFVLPHDAGQRPAWMIRAGLFLYDHLAGRKKLQGSKSINLQAHVFGEPLKESFTKGFCYADCWADDARLVVLNAMSAAAKGAHILTRTACTQLDPAPDHWMVSLKDLITGQDRQIKADMVVNAAGPWVRGLLAESDLITPAVPQIRLVKGSHIVVRRRYKGEHSYILQQPDRRIVFVIPYEGEFTLIGTTEVDFKGDPIDAAISYDEKEYLFRAYNNAFKDSIVQEDVVWTYSGVRPLFDDGGESSTSVTRDYHLHHHTESGAPMISVFGGKLTTYRVLAEQVVNNLLNLDHRPGKSWTAHEALPGGDILDGDFAEFLRRKIAHYPFLPESLLYRYARSYGTRMDRFLEGVQALEGLGRHFGDSIYEAEVVYLVRAEFARTAEDILWRRSKLGLHVSAQTLKNLEKALPTIAQREEAA